MRTALLLVVSLTVCASGQEKKRESNYPPVLEGATAEVYKRAGGVDLKIWIYTPVGHKADDKRAAIVFFFGGGWSAGSPKQFEQHSKLLASRGMVAMVADYRVATRHQAKVSDCIRDAKAAVRWARANAKRLGIDANRIAAGGGSAGGHLAASTAVIPGMEHSDEDLKVSSRPDALVLFNPALVLAKSEEGGLPPEVEAKLIDRFGAPARAVSPFHNLKAGAPPTIIFHGKADTTVPYATAEAYSKRMTSLGGKCVLEGYEGQTHGFFNYGRGGDEYYAKTTERMVTFLSSLGYLASK